MEIEIFRNPRQLRVRKWVLSLVDNGKVYDTRFMFGGLFFKKRLKRKMERMLEMRKKISEVFDELNS